MISSWFEIRCFLAVPLGNLRNLLVVDGQKTFSQSINDIDIDYKIKLKFGGE